MGRRGGRGQPPRRKSTLIPSIIRRRIDSCKINHLPSDDIAEHLYSSYPDYKHYKLIPFRNKIKLILRSVNRNDVVDVSDTSDLPAATPPSRRKRRNDDEECRLLRREDDYAKRRKDVLAEDEDEDEDEDASFGEDVEPEFDLMNSMLRDQYTEKSSSKSKSKLNSEDFSNGGSENSSKLNSEDFSSKYSSKLNSEDFSSENSKDCSNDSSGNSWKSKLKECSSEKMSKSKRNRKKLSKSKQKECENGGSEDRNVEMEDVRTEKKVSGRVVAGQSKSGSEVVEEEGEIKVKGKDGKMVMFKDFGGIKNVIDELIMEVIVPLYHPELPRWIGVKPMSGILLHGPPGCGKTRLAQAIANETGVPFYQISATDIVSGVSGASEENIRELFSKAYQTAPSIVFIDEIDAIASKRENLQREMERRIVTQLLTCMDESHRMVKISDKNADTEIDDKKSGHVLVIGATNRPDAVDTALRRPGRFDREIALGVPDENARADILSVLTENLRLAGDFDLIKIAKSTPGFVGADLVALANKAGNLAMKRIIDHRRSELSKEEQITAEEWWKEPWSPEEMKKLSITMSDFEDAVKLVQPSLRREGFSTIPDVKWEDVGGLDELRRQFELYIVNRIKYPTQYEESGVDLELGFLLYGPPGCGKTLIAKAVASEAGANFIHIKGPELLNKYVGESESHVRRIFSRARTCAPCIIFFDEVDALTTERGKEGGWVVERLLNQLLIELNGGDRRRGVFVIGATNRPEVMDHALLRPGRFGKLLFVPLPSSNERGLILKALARKKPIEASVDLLDLGTRCENMSGADLSALVNEAAMAALEEKLESTTVYSGCPSSIKSVHFEQALNKVKPSVSDKVKKNYEKLSQTFRAA